MKQKLMVCIILTLTIVSVAAGCGNNSTGSAAVTEDSDYTLIATSEDGYALWQKTNENGLNVSKLTKSEELLYTSTNYSGKDEFVAFLDNYLLMMTSVENQDGMLELWAEKLEDDDLDTPVGAYTVLGKFQEDEFNVFPKIVNAEKNGSNILIECRYHVTADEFSEETILYSVDLREIALEMQ